MSEVKYQVKTFLIDMKCDKCGEGYMRPVGNVVLTSYPLQYPHECDVCGFRENYTKTYPYETYEKYLKK